MDATEDQAIKAVRGLNETIAALREQQEDLREQLKRQIEMHQNFVQALITETQALNGKTESQYEYPKNVYPTIHGEIK